MNSPHTHHLFESYSSFAHLVCWTTEAFKLCLTRPGYEYLTIVDNAFPIVNLLVYNASSGKQLCKQPIFDINSRYVLKTTVRHQQVNQSLYEHGSTPI